MTDTVPRRTGQRDTAAATVASINARRRDKAQRLATELGDYLRFLDDRWLAALAGRLVGEYELRGIPVPDLLGEDEA